MDVRERLAEGLVIPAHPLALTSARKLDERRQRALTRYYLAAGAGGVAVGVHTTQFAIRDPQIGLYRPVLELAMEEAAKRRCRKDCRCLWRDSIKRSEKRNLRASSAMTRCCSAWVD